METKTKLIVMTGLLVMLVAVVAVEFRPPERPSPDRISVRLPIPVIEAGQTPFYVAADRGFYEAENLVVKFELGTPELNPVNMVSTENDDFGILGGPDTLLVANGNGADLQAIAILHYESNFPCLLVLESAGISRLDQLRDKKVGFFYGHISTDVLRNLFRKENVRVEEVDIGFDYNQLLTRRISAAWAFRVTAGLDLPAAGHPVQILSPADYGITTHGYTVFARREYLGANPDLVIRFLRATFRGVAYSLKNPEAANEILLKRDPTIDRDLSLRRLQLYNAVSSAPPLRQFGFMNAKMFQETYSRLIEEQVIERQFDPMTAFTTAFLEDAQPDQ